MHITNSKSTPFFLISSTLILIFALVLFSVLILSSLHKQYYEGVFSLESFSSGRFAHKLSQSAKFGIPPKRVANLSELVQDYQKQSQAYRVLVLDKNTDILAQYNSTEAFSLPSRFNEQNNGVVHFTEGDTIWIVQPITAQNNALFRSYDSAIAPQKQHDLLHLQRALEKKQLIHSNTHIEGYLVHGINRDIIFTKLKHLIYTNLYTITGISIFSILLLYILIYTINNSSKIKNSTYKKFYMCCALIIPLALAQIIFTITLYNPMLAIQKINATNMAKQLSSNIAGELRHLNKLDVPIDSIVDAENHLMQLQTAFDWNAMIRIYSNTNVMHILNPLITQGISTQEQEVFRDSITKPQNGNAPIMSATMFSERDRVDVFVLYESIERNMQQILLDILTIMVITFVFLMEFITVLFIAEANRKKHKNVNTTIQDYSIFDNVHIIRPITFICFFCVFLPSSFISLRMAQISPSFLGLSQEVTMSLPISIEFFSAGLSIFLSGFISNRLGWRNLFLAGCIVVSLANAMSALCDNALLFIIARGIAGFGYGFINISPQLFTIEKSKSENRSQNLAFMVAGVYAGVLCSSAFGGLIADRLGYVATFLTTCAFMACMAIFALRYMPNTSLTNTKSYGIQPHSESSLTADAEHAPKEKEYATACNKAPTTLLDILRFLCNIPMAGLLFMYILPNAFVTICLFNYYIPVSLNGSCANPADIGRVAMFYSLVIMYLGPFFGRMIDKGMDNRAKNNVDKAIFWLFASSIIAIMAILCLSSSNSISMSMIAVSLLGFANAIMFSSQGPYALGLPIARTIKQGQVVAIYNVTERLGQVLGPICFAILLSFMGATYSLYVIASVFAIMSILLLLSAFYKKVK